MWKEMGMPAYVIEILDPINSRQVAETKRVNKNFDDMANYVAYKKLIRLIKTVAILYKNSMDIELLKDEKFKF